MGFKGTGLEAEAEQVELDWIGLDQVTEYLDGGNNRIG